MKIQMTINEKQLPNYHWLDPSNEKFDSNYGKAIDKLETGLPTEFYAPDFINYIEWDQFKQLFNNMHLKLRKNGKVILGGIDPYIIAKKLVSRKMNWQSYNNIIFPFFQNLIPLAEVKQLLLSYNYSILDIQIDTQTSQYTLEAQK